MKKNQLLLLYVLSAVAIVAGFFIDPIRQNPNYHHFADQRTWLSIPNFWNVATNLPFVIVGIIGLQNVYSPTSPKSGFTWFFIGILLTGIGSGYYHFQPDSVTLIWDRLPMTISFMSFLSIIIGEFINANAGKNLLYPLLAIGIASIIVWVASDDLRMYALVQFLPIALILIVLFASKENSAYKKYFWLIIVFYTIAKFLESYDLLIYNTTRNTISGHALKHLAVAVAPFLLLKYVNSKYKHSIQYAG